MKLSDATIIVSIVTGGLYFSGYIYNVHYLDYFSAPPLLFSSDVANNVMTGWQTIFDRGLWVFCILGLLVFFKTMFLKDTQVTVVLSKYTNSFSMKLLTIFLVMFCLYINASDLGRFYAKKQFNYAPANTFTFKTAKYNGNYRVVAFNKGVYLLLNEKKDLMIIAQSEIESIRFVSAMHKEI